MIAQGSRAEADSDSDLDIPLVRPDQVPDETWQEHLVDLAEQVRSWSGNACEPLLMTQSELRAALNAMTASSTNYSRTQFT